MLPAVDVTPDNSGPPPPPAPPAPPRLFRRALVGGVVFVLVAGLVFGGISAFRFFRGAGDRLASLVPDDAAVYVTAYLDPAGSQKLAALGLLGKFPNLGSQAQVDSAINQALDTALAPAGLGHNDVRPWVGGQLAVMVSATAPATAGAGVGTPLFAYLIASNDDSKAQSALIKYESSSAGKAMTWVTHTHAGVTVNVGQGEATGETHAWAIVDGTVVGSNGEALVDELIDTAHGNHATLTSTADFTTLNGRLPADRLALAYVDVPRLARLVTTGLARSSAPLGDLSAYHGAGMTLSATSDGVEINGVADVDAGKLSGASRNALAIAPHVNSTLAFVPLHAYGMYALTGLPQLIRSLLDQFAHGSSGQNAAPALSFITPLLAHMTGDAGFEVGAVAGRVIPAGALFVGVDSDASGRQLTSTLELFGCGSTGACDPQKTTSQVYRGTTITTLRISSDLTNLGVAPSWAVSDGMAIIASSPDEVRAVLDARAGGNVTGSLGYRTAIGHADSSNNGVLYLDVGSIAAAVRAALPGDARQQYDQQVAPYLNPFKTFVLTSRSASDRVTLRAFFEIR